MRWPLFHCSSWLAGGSTRVTHSPYFQPTVSIINLLINIDIGKQWFDLLTIGILWWVAYYIVFEMIFLFIRVHILLIYTTLYCSLWLKCLLWYRAGSLWAHLFAWFHQYSTSFPIYGDSIPEDLDLWYLIITL